MQSNALIKSQQKQVHIIFEYGKFIQVKVLQIEGGVV